MSRRNIIVCNRCIRQADTPENVQRPVGWLSIDISDNPRATSKIDLCPSCAGELRDWIVKHDT